MDGSVDPLSASISGETHDSVNNNDNQANSASTSSNTYEQELIRRSVDQFFGEFAMVTDDVCKLHIVSHGKNIVLTIFHM